MSAKRMAGGSRRRRATTRKAPRTRPARAVRAKAAPRRARAVESRGLDKNLRDDVIYLLRGRGAHVTFERAVETMPPELQGTKPAGVPYSAWQQLEHLRRAQRDILDYVRDPDYVEKAWPDDYWPEAAPPSLQAWADAVRAFEADRQAFIDLVADPKTDLLSRVPHDPKGPSILHEALLVADHNAYHLGQLLVLRRALGAWTDE